MRTLAAVLLLAFLPLVHLAGARPFLIFDDLVWLHDVRAHPGVAGIARSFVTTPFGYRPVAALHLRGASAVAGSDPAALHVLDLLTVGLAAIAAFLFARGAIGTPAALAGAALWEVHPATQALGGFVSDAGGRWFVALGFASLIARRRWLSGGGATWRMVAIGAFALAVLAKEWALLTVPALLACDGAGGEPRRLLARLREIWPELAIGSLLGTRILLVALERGRGDLVAYRADPAALERFGRGWLFAAVPSGRLQGLVGPGSIAAALLGVAAVIATVVLWRRTGGVLRVLLACAAGWLVPVVPYVNFDLPSQGRYVAPAALPAMLLVGAAIAAGRAAVRGAAAVSVAAVAGGAALGLLRSPPRDAPLPAGPGVHLVVMSELLGFPENARRIRLEPAALGDYLALPLDREPGVATVLDRLRRGRAAEWLGRDAEAAEHYRRAVAAAKGQGTMPLPAFWLGDARVTPEEIERYAGERGYVP